MTGIAPQYLLDPELPPEILQAMIEAASRPKDE